LRNISSSAFAESRAQLGGYYVVEAPDLDAALGMAKKCPQPFGGVEVRQVIVSG
jgi:hypothetical protein